MRKEIKRLS